MEKEFVPFNESLELKELGFNEPCFGWFASDKSLVKDITTKTDFILAPTFSQAFRWFREKHGLFIQPNRTIDFEGIWYYFSIETKRTDICEGSFVYENAELACLKKLIQIVKNK